MIGAYALVLGVIAIGGAFWIPLLSGGDRALLTVSGLVSILFGVVMFAKPGDGALVLLALIAAYALIVGVTELTVAIGAKRIVERTAALRPGRQARAATLALTEWARGCRTSPARSLLP